MPIQPSQMPATPPRRGCPQDIQQRPRTLRILRSLRTRLAAWLALGMLCLLGVLSPAATAAEQAEDYKLSVGDLIRILVFQNPDLTLETRISESGTVSYPLIGTARLGSLSIANAERELARQLQEGGFVRNPQVTIVLVQNRGNQIAVLGYVKNPGRFPLDTNTRVSEMLAIAGGAAMTGADTAILTGTRNGQTFRKEVDIAAIFMDSSATDNILIQSGDTLYVPRAPMFYVYGEVQRPGMYRIERNMTVQQALAVGGGPTARGTEMWLRVHRKNKDGQLEKISVDASDPIRPDDVLYVRESLF